MAWEEAGDRLRAHDRAVLRFYREDPIEHRLSADGKSDAFYPRIRFRDSRGYDETICVEIPGRIAKSRLAVPLVLDRETRPVMVRWLKEHGGPRRGEHWPRDLNKFAEENWSAKTKALAERRV